MLSQLMYSPLFPIGTMLRHIVITETVTLATHTTHSRMQLLVIVEQGHSRVCLDENDRSTTSRTSTPLMRLLYLVNQGSGDNQGLWDYALYGALGKSWGYKTCTECSQGQAESRPIRGGKRP
jgi:hypothetical protein